MIEIIREEETNGTIEKRGLPKDIKQIGRPDIGDRIYVENQVYQFLHPYNSLEEKKAYVLLGRFENYAGRQCVFIEAAIPLKEIDFDGELPLWNDQTWAYIYKQLRREYDSMVIVGWAMDIKGQLPNMTVRLENLHQQNFGGAHQVLYLMDSLECEEAFYGSRNGHLYRREGFYVYYEKQALTHKTREGHHVPEKDIHAHEKEFLSRGEISHASEKEALVSEKRFTSEETADTLEERFASKEVTKGKGYASREKNADILEEKFASEEISKGKGYASREKNADILEEKFASEEMDMLEKNFSMEEEQTGLSKKYESDSDDLFGQAPKTFYRGSYRKQMSDDKEQERPIFSSYASTMLLFAVVCVLGVTAYMNHEKMNAMEETLAQMNRPQTTATEQKEASSDGVPAVTVETVNGNVQKQTTDSGGADTAGTDVAQSGEMGAQTNAAEGQTETGQAETGQTGAGQTGAGQAGAGQAGTGQTETGQTGTEQTGTEQTGIEQTGTEQTGTGQAEAGQTGTGQSGSVQSSTGQAGENVDATASNDASSDGTATNNSPTDAQTYLNQGYYVVQKGDSLVGICKKIYQTTAMLDKLCEVNGIEDQDSIYAGQYLTLPN